MDCEQAFLLISAQIDRAIEAAERDRLEAHLADCPACRATAEAFALQDRELRETFAPRRAAAAVVAERVNALLPLAPAATGRPTRRRRLATALLSPLVAAACLLLVFWLTARPSSRPPERPAKDAGPRATSPAQEGLRPRARPAPPEAPLLAVGQTVDTRAGERRRFRLPDHSVLYVNQESKLALDAERQATLSAGEIFVEVARRQAGAARPTFVVKTPTRDVIALGTKFDVRADGRGTGVAVAQGRVEVAPTAGDGSARAAPVVAAGQRVGPGRSDVSPGPRASHVLDWTRDLMAAAESPLVPASTYDGGALVAVDPYGQEAKLALRKYHVDVHIEDGFARTTIDQTYFNNHPWRLEGTFYFPLPPDASLSRLAMYVDGTLMEGGMAERDYARNVYEQIVTSQRDPALLEWVDGSTFKMRVFPLEGRQEKRIILSYTQRLPSLYGRTQYRFPTGHSLPVVRDWSFRALVKGGAGLASNSPTHPEMQAEKQGGDLVLTAARRGATLDRDVVVDLTDTAAEAPERARLARCDADGSTYLMLRFRPDLPAKAERPRRNWVFLYESSADRDPLLARVQIDVIRHLLENVEHDDTFAVLTTGTRVRRFADEPMPATPENVAAAVAFLEQTHLVGTLDLGTALAAAADLLKDAPNPHLVHLGSGLAGMGERQEALAKHIPAGTRYIGIGVGKHWGRSFMKDCAARTGGYFTQINPDEPIAWRAFDLLATLNTPRLLDAKVEADTGPAGQGSPPHFLIDNASVCQGEELFAVARLDGSGAAGGPAQLPRSVTITGSLDGQPYRHVIEVRNVAPGAGYLPRTWAKLEIERMLAEDAAKNKDRIVALSKAMYVMTPFTSLLVLENEAMYQQYKVDRGRKDHWAMYPCPPRIPVVFEPDPTQPVDVRNAPKDRKPTRSEVLPTILTRPALRFLHGREQRESYGLPDSWGRVVENNLERLHLGDLDRRASGAPGYFSYFGFMEQQATLRQLVSRPLDWSPPYNPITGESLGSFAVQAGKRFRRIPYRAAPPPITLVDAVTFSPDGTRLALASGGDPTVRLWDLEIRGRELARPMFPTRAPEVSPYLNLLRSGAPPALNYYHLAQPTPGAADPGDPNLIYRIQTEPPAFERLARIETEADLEHRARSVSPLRMVMITGSFPYRGDLENFMKEQLTEGRALPSLLYEPPAFSEDPRLFRDLLAYAPGLNTSPADMDAVLEAEAAPELRVAPGHIDPAARRLIERARSGPWQTLTLPGGKRRPGLTLHFDPAGRFAWERTLPVGLRERVVCDGRTLLHLYPELGLAARRTVSRFHRAELLALLPWLVPPGEDLAHGADLECIGENTVALVPHGANRESRGKRVPYVSLHLVFAPDGHLAERRLVQMPEDTMLAREVYDGEGGARVLDADGKEIASRTRKLAPAPAPDLHPDTSRLVVLPLPYRSRNHTFPALDLDPAQPLAAERNGCYACATPEQALTLLATAQAEQRADEARLIYRDCFESRDDDRPGFFPLLAAAGVDLLEEVGFRRYLSRHPREPLARYLALNASETYQFLQQYLPVRLGEWVARPDTFLGRLAVLRDLYLRWREQPSPWIARALRRRDEERTLAFVRRNPGLVMSRALLAYVQARGGHDKTSYLAFAETWALLGGASEGAYGERYQQARCLLHGGRRAEARKLFQELYAAVLQDGLLPRIDGDFRDALQGDGKGADAWSTLMRQTAAGFVARKRRPAVAALAWQCRQLGDTPLADTLVRVALDGLQDEGERLPTTLAVIQYLCQGDDLARADELLHGLLAADAYARDAGLWRLASTLAERRGLADRSVNCLERALDLEYQDLPAVIDLQAWRRDYGRLLNHYETLASALNPLHAPPPDDLAARTVRAADRWRAHDPEATGPCQTASRILRALGARDLAWDYLTTSVGRRPGESAPWRELARTLSRAGDHELADRAFAVACATDPDDPLLLWDRAQNLRQGGRNDEADHLLRRIADRDWPAHLQNIRARARWQLERR